MAHWTVGLALAYCDERAAGRSHLEKTEAFYDPQQHAVLAHVFGLDPGVAVRVHLGWILSYLGYLDQGLAKAEEAVTLARQLGHTHTLCWVLGLAMMPHLFRRDWQTVHDLGDEALHLAEENGFEQLAAYDSIEKGLGLAGLGDAENGIALIHDGLGRNRALGSTLSLPWLLRWLALAHALGGQWDEAHRALDESEQVAHRTGETLGLLVVTVTRGIFLEQTGESEAAEKELLEGLEMTRESGARLYELQAATSLARIWASKGERREAVELLAPLYDWFTEGFDTAPLQDAKSVLDALRGG